MTGGAEINIGGHKKFICVNSRGARGHEKFIPARDQMNKVKTKDSKRFSGLFCFFPAENRVISKKKKISTEIVRDFPAKIGNSSGFSGRKQVISKTKKVFIPEMSWNPVSVHKKHENNSGKHQFGPRFALQ